MGTAVTPDKRKTLTPFKVKPKDLGELKLGLRLDKICELLDLEDADEIANVGRTLKSDRFSRGR